MNKSEPFNAVIYTEILSDGSKLKIIKNTETDEILHEWIEWNQAITKVD